MDTLHTFIRDYQEKKKIMLNMEHRLMLRVRMGGGNRRRRGRGRGRMKMSEMVGLTACVTL